MSHRKKKFLSLVSYLHVTLTLCMKLIHVCLLIYVIGNLLGILYSPFPILSLDTVHVDEDDHSHGVEVELHECELEAGV